MLRRAPEDGGSPAGGTPRNMPRAGWPGGGPGEPRHAPRAASQATGGSSSSMWGRRVRPKETGGGGGCARDGGQERPHRGQEAGDVQAAVGREVGGQVAAVAGGELARTLEVAALEMVQADGGLNQTLEEVRVAGFVGEPDLLELLVRPLVMSLVEERRPVGEQSADAAPDDLPGVEVLGRGLDALHGGNGRRRDAGAQLPPPSPLWSPPPSPPSPPPRRRPSPSRRLAGRSSSAGSKPQ